MEKINFCSAMQPKSLKEFPEERCEFCADYYRAADVDALLADVRRLVEAAGKSVWFEKQHLKATCPGCLEYPNDTCSHGEEFSPIVQLLTQAIAAVERHLATIPPHSSPPPADTGRA